MAYTPVSGPEDAGIRTAYPLATSDQIRRLEIRNDDAPPWAAIGQLLNEPGGESWELMALDMATSRGVFKRPRT